MGFGKKCHRYFEKRNHKVMHLVGKVTDGYEKEDYHELRVEIKKIKAFLKLAKYATDIDDKKFFGPYAEIFKNAGLVRDAQMAEALLRKERPLKWLQQYCGELKTEADLHEKDFYLGVRGKIKEDLAKNRKRAIPFIKKIEKDKAKKFLRKEERKINSILGEKNISIEDAHQLRKKLKRMGYVAGLMKGKKRAVGEIEKVHEALGSWHDQCELAGRLRRDAAKQPDKQRKIHMLNLEKVVKARAKKMFSDINRSIRRVDPKKN